MLNALINGFLFSIIAMYYSTTSSTIEKKCTKYAGGKVLNKSFNHRANFKQKFKTQNMINYVNFLVKRNIYKLACAQMRLNYTLQLV